ncbi:MAG TPA: DUF4157 domain-containing protein, partial [Chloroflexi bacterium]|nr:DUF4157 domain-containing protein [Chloroflexota bacterium]
EELQLKPLVQRQAEYSIENRKSKIENRKPLVQRQTPEEEEELQLKPLPQPKPLAQKPLVSNFGHLRPIVNRQSSIQNPKEGFETSDAFNRSLSASSGGGSPLPDQLRADFEPKFGADFGNVRAHTGSKAAQLNRDIGSRAFTRGQDIFFGGGQYQPETTGGKRLIAHELTHTIQQGAAGDRISPWWPKGHKLVTELGIEEGGFSRQFDRDSRKFLIDNSPDMDYIQDVYDTMGEGGKIGDTRLALYEGLIRSGKPEELTRAREMYDNNELHIRRKVYMQMHGEAGEYKVDRATAAARNEAVTNKFVEKAANLWPGVDGDANAKMQSLTVLSDALHQAGDRGSHEEGAAFQGHDVRLQLGVKGQGKYEHWYKKSREPQPWERPYGGSKEGKGGQKWDTDNFVVNKEGLVLGVGFVQGALSKFVEAINLGEGEQVDIYGLEQPEKRKLKAKKFAPKSTSGSKMTSLGVTFAGKTGLGVWGTVKERKKDKTRLREVFRETKRAMALKDAEDNVDNRYNESRRSVSDNVPEGFENLLAQGMAFYDTGVKREDTIEIAKTQFRIWKKPRWRGGLSKEDRQAQAIVYFNGKVGPAQNDPNQDAILVAKHIKIAYKDVFGEELGGVIDPVDGPKTEYDLRAEAYAGAHAHFKHWGQKVFTKTERRKLARKYLQQHNDKSDIEKDSIKLAYRALFGEEIPTEAHEKFREWGQARAKGGLKKRNRRSKALEYIKEHSATPQEGQEVRTTYANIFGSSLGSEFRTNFKQIRQRFKKNTSVGAFEKRHRRLRTVDAYLRAYERREKADGDKAGRKQLLEGIVIPNIINPLITAHYFKGRLQNIHNELVTLRDILQEIANDLTAEIENE